MKTKNRLQPLYISISALIIMLSGCSTWRKLDDTEKGAVIGGGSGAVVGNAVAPGLGGTVVGGALGAVGGGLIGHESDEDRRRRR
jgi:uncharacterized protein YcfJ